MDLRKNLGVIIGEHIIWGLSGLCPRTVWRQNLQIPVGDALTSKQLHLSSLTSFDGIVFIVVFG